MTPTYRLASVRPMVRYVDEDEAIIEARLEIVSRLPGEPPPRHAEARVHLEVRGDDGFFDEADERVELTDGAGVVRYHVVHPERWWPASMGKQPLYQLTVAAADGPRTIGRQQFTLGLTSVSRQVNDETAGLELRVNGQACPIDSVVVIDRVDENQLLPAAGDSLLLVRDHYGPDVLYHAADRAGILMIQCVPIDPRGKPEWDVVSHVDRLIAHPSLAGWFVGHLGKLSDQVAERIRQLDPTRTVFRRIPSEASATDTA